MSKKTKQFSLQFGRRRAKRTHTGRRITVLTDSQVSYYMVFRGRSGAQSLLRFSRSLRALCRAGNMRIEPVWLANEKRPENSLLR